MREISDYLFPLPYNNFQQLFRVITQPNLNAPNGEAVKQMMDIYQGNNPSIHSQIAFAMLLQLIRNSQDYIEWTFQIKTIIILNRHQSQQIRLIQNCIFCKEISQLSQNMFDSLPSETMMGLRTYELVASLWRLVRYQSQILDLNQHVFCYKRRQRRQFLKSLSFKEILKQLQTLESLFWFCFQVLKQLHGRESENYKQGQLYSIDLIQHFALTVAHKLVVLYACELLCFQISASKVIFQQEADLKQLGRYCSRFQSSSFQFIEFLKCFKGSNGLEQFNNEEMNPFQTANLPAMINTLLKNLQERNNPQERSFTYLGLLNYVDMHVEFYPFGDIELQNRPLRPRIRCPSQKQISSSAFTEWNISFSDSFPKQQIMTLDLIMDILKEQEGYISDRTEYNLNNERQYSDEFNKFTQSSDHYLIVLSQDKNIEPSLFKNYHIPFQNSISFDNIYRLHEEKWNQL